MIAGLPDRNPPADRDDDTVLSAIGLFLLLIVIGVLAVFGLVVCLIAES